MIDHWQVVRKAGVGHPTKQVDLRLDNVHNLCFVAEVEYCQSWLARVQAQFSGRPEPRDLLRRAFVPGRFLQFSHEQHEGMDRLALEYLPLPILEVDLVYPVCRHRERFLLVLAYQPPF
jgi:hypothetical protein